MRADTRAARRRLNAVPSGPRVTIRARDWLPGLAAPHDCGTGLPRSLEQPAEGVTACYCTSMVSTLIVLPSSLPVTFAVTDAAVALLGSLALLLPLGSADRSARFFMASAALVLPASFSV